MNKILCLIIVILVVLLSNVSQSTEILEDTPEMRMMYDAIEFENKILIFGTLNSQKGNNQFFSSLKISSLSNDKLSDFSNLDNNGDSIKVSIPKVIKDSENNLWLCGNGIFKYFNGKWHKYEINDEHKDLRAYANLTFDKNGILWGTASVYSKDYYESLIFKYENNEFKIFDKVDVYLKHNKLITLDNKIFVFNYYSFYNKPYRLDTIFDITEYDIISNEKLRDFNIPSYEDPNFKDIYYSKDYNYVNVIKDSIIYILKGISEFYDTETKQKGYCCNETVMLTNGKFEFLKDKIQHTENFDASGYYVSNYQDKILFSSLNNRQNYIIENNDKIIEVSNKDIIKNSKIIKIRKAISDESILDVNNSVLIPLKLIEYNDQLILVTSGRLLIYKNIYPLNIENEITNNKEVIIYPNPSSDFITINDNIEIKNIEITDLLGIRYNMIIEDKIINIENLNNGIYQIIITDTNNMLHVSKFVKN